MDQFTKEPFNNPALPPAPKQPTAGVFGRAVATIAIWSGRAAMIGGGLVLGTALLPANLNPFHYLATGMGQMESDETKAAMAAKAEMARQTALAQSRAQAEVQTLKESLDAQVAIGQTADWMCAASMLFGQGGNTDYPEVRDGLRAACGVSAANRQQMMDEYHRNTQGSR